MKKLDAEKIRIYLVENHHEIENILYGDGLSDYAIRDIFGVTPEEYRKLECDPENIFFGVVQELSQYY